MLNIATINIQNKYKIKKYNGLLEKEDHIKMLLELIQKYELNIIGLQEVNPRYYDRLKKMLPSKYNCYGDSRYRRNIITKNIEVLETFNESVPLITDQFILKKATKYLPWITSYVPRIVTIMQIKTKDFGEVVVFNTHLDNRKNKTKIKELRRLLKMIRNVTLPVILMGDFNMTTQNEDFKSFMREMEKLDINHLEIKEATFKKSKSNIAIDHVFLSKCFHLESVFLYKDKRFANFSDHYPIILKLHLGFSKK